MDQPGFHVILQARPSSVPAGLVVALGGLSLPTLAVSMAEAMAPFAFSFEDAYRALEALPRLFIEPDGAWVWRGDSWQLDGVLYDRDGRLLHVELKGACPASHFNELLAACGWPAAPVMFQLVRHAVFVDETTFRQTFLE